MAITRRIHVNPNKIVATVTPINLDFNRINADSLGSMNIGLSGSCLRDGFGGCMGLKRNIVVLILTCVLSTIDAGAQTVSGQITGVIKDSTGAVLPGVTVSAKNTGTGFTRTILTNESGVYAMPSIPIGTYEISAELADFKRRSEAA